MKIVLLVLDGRDSYHIFKDAFKDTIVEVIQEEIKRYCSNNNYDAIVSPANSFGILDGGVDEMIRDIIPGIQDSVQKAIRDTYSGEQPVGTCLLVKAEKYLFHCPTMRIPTKLPKDSINAYLAFRAFLITAKRNKFKTIVCLPMCTGTGRMSSETSARQMRAAYDSVYNDDGEYPSWGHVAKLNQKIGIY